LRKANDASRLRPGKMCCYGEWLCESENGRIKLAKATLKATKPRLDLEQLALDRKDRNQISNLLVNVRMKCHEYIRLRDYGKPCISCNAPWSEDFHACHLYKAELYSSLKFNEFNISGGCRKCNLFMDGNESGYRVGLLNRYGRDYLERLDIMAQNDKKQDFKWNRLDKRVFKYSRYMDEKWKNSTNIIWKQFSFNFTDKSRNKSIFYKSSNSLHIWNNEKYNIFPICYNSRWR